ncbi:MAG: enoyl-CoA hydratase [Acidiferrobacteraceae bacterium]|jgi:2-(1,2-epoxy-1,2-dihydrophenyl)acetyl-CoA isomerase|nr:enoyl-CoA hydratase [Acidiferrobacteraceae bacterium]MCP4830087.1 enoyl-CoA hydratase/isomerase family protein [Pseudomonadota bacterium]|tara:strand:- start:3430 stop:4230 length:801 start_codon:yes stop_codon:yes gene_type:complete
MEHHLELTHIDYQRDQAIAVICLNQPEGGNTLSRQMALDLLSATQEAQNDQSVRAVVFSAHGPMFSFGGDLKEFQRFGKNAEELVTVADRWHEAQQSFLTMPKPVVVGVNGMAAGGGVPMTLVGDIVLVDETARYRLAYTAAGLSPDGGSTWLLPRLIGLRRTQELIFENRELSAAEAVEWGLATRTVPQGSALDAAIALAHTFSKGATQAFASSRRMLHASFDNDFMTQTAMETQEIGANMTGSDGQEGLDAFINKRLPEFTGKQ